jgi:hypothetical protein
MRSAVTHGAPQQHRRRPYCSATLNQQRGVGNEILRCGEFLLKEWFYGRDRSLCALPVR